MTEITSYDIAKYILQKTGKISKPKLHFLLYYCYIWYYLYFKTKLFEDKITACEFGPKINNIYKDFGLNGTIINISNDDRIVKYSLNLNITTVAILDSVIERYNQMYVIDLSELMYKEPPYLNAVKRDSKEFSDSDIYEYYIEFK